MGHQTGNTQIRTEALRGSRAAEASRARACKQKTSSRRGTRERKPERVSQDANVASAKLATELRNGRTAVARSGSVGAERERVAAAVAGQALVGVCQCNATHENVSKPHPSSTPADTST